MGKNGNGKDYKMRPSSDEPLIFWLKAYALCAAHRGIESDHRKKQSLCYSTPPLGKA